MSQAASATVADAVAALRRGDRRALARILSALEDGTQAGSDALALVRDGAATARTAVVAITGPPGVGKSTLVASFARIAGEGGSPVAVLAVDPSSHLTGGAVLGDRIRMATEVGPHVYIRSFANRGAMGGLAHVLPGALDLVAAAGYGLVIVETVGVGQSEIDVARYADVTVVVLAPSLGDEVQAAKAGLMEIADVFVVNKCDLPDAGVTVRAVRNSIRLRQVGSTDVPVLMVSAGTGENVAEAWRQISGLVGCERGAEARRAAARFDELAAATVERLRAAAAEPHPESLLGRVLSGRMPATVAADELARGAAEVEL